MVYDLEDLRMWEPLLFGATSQKQLILDVLKKTEKKMKSKINKDDEVSVCVCVYLHSVYYTYLKLSQSNPVAL